jgi:hypothetical protein
MDISDVSDKSAITLAPIVGIIAAVSYDVGYFFGIDLYYFSFFSLTEHVVFALEAMPIVILLGLVAGLVGVGVVHLQRSSRIATWLLDRFRSIFLMVSGGCVLLDHLLGRQDDDVIFPIVLLALAVFIIGLLKSVAPKNVGFEKIAAGAYLVMISFSMGSLFSTSYVERVSNLNTLNLKSGEVISGNLIRAGDRGVLFYDKVQNVLEFRQWDEIKMVAGKLLTARKSRSD